MALRLTFFVSCAALLSLIQPVAYADPAPALTPDQTKAVNQMIHDYLLNNPQVLIEAVQHAEDTAKADEAAATTELIKAHRDDLEHDPGSPVMGNPSGDVTIVEFFDYRCPYCKANEAAVEQLLQSDKKVRLVLKEYPILGADSQFASRVALVAWKHGKYAEFHKALFALSGKPNPQSTLDVAKSVGLDPALVKKEMESSEIDALLKRPYDLGRTLKVDGTPSYFVGTTEAPGAVTLESLRELVAAARKG
jgi:protein-disulfide isomerase